MSFPVITLRPIYGTILSTSYLVKKWLLMVKYHQFQSKRPEEYSSFKDSVPIKSNSRVKKSRRQDTINRQLSDIKFEIKNLRKTFERIENLLLSKTANNLEIGETEEDLFQNLPVSSVEELENFNIKLEDKQVLNRLVAFLYVLGGEDAHKTIYVMLKKVMTNEVAQLFSTQGRKQKRAFLELKNLYGAITTATRKRHQNANLDAIKKSVGLYLASAKARSAQKQPNNM
ncbi:hypothetical protein RN001_001700 [Aquatica leii]|uniref:DUF4806 domain-containing protein n=1 Tax=Aquatica leii TaxID=1421715 RepID=A0AAN7PG84_9COLE|nr:hypothetical protein RN001_001700 [Aquatica leii]